MKIPEELEAELMKIAASKYNNNKSMVIIKAIEQFIANPDNQTDTEIDKIKKDIASINQELSQVHQKLVLLESSIVQLLRKDQK